MAIASDSLFELIKKLDKSEINGVKAHLARGGKKKTESVSQQMFNAICRMKQFNEKLLWQAVSRQRKKNRQPMLNGTGSVHKNYLKNEILSFLVNTNKSQTREWHEQLEAIEILRNRGLITEAMRQVNLFKKSINDTPNKMYLPIANHYTSTLIPLIAEENRIERISQHANETLQVNYHQYLSAKIYVYYLRALSLQMGGMLISDKESLAKLEELLNDELNRMNTDEMSDGQRRLFYYGQAALLNLNAQYEKAFQYTQKIWDMAQVAGEIKDKLVADKLIDDANNFLDGCIQSKNIKAMRPVLEVMEGLVGKYHPGNLASLSQIRHYTFFITLMTGTDNELKKVLFVHEKFHRDYYQKLDLSFRKNLEIDMVHGFNKIKAFKKSIRYLDALTGIDANADIGDRLKDFLLLYGLHIYYERTFYAEKEETIDLAVFATKVEALHRRLKNKADSADTRVEEAVIRCFQQIIQSETDSEKHKFALQKLKTILLNLEKQGVLYLKQINNSFKITEWVIKQIERLSS